MRKSRVSDINNTQFYAVLYTLFKMLYLQLDNIMKWPMHDGGQGRRGGGGCPVLKRTNFKVDGFHVNVNRQFANQMDFYL